MHVGFVGRVAGVMVMGGRRGEGNVVPVYGGVVGFRVEEVAVAGEVGGGVGV